jgi:hypothetical protein
MGPRFRRLLLLGALGSLILAALAGLERLGYSSPAGRRLAPWHGVLMTGGFSGLLISLERAVALEAAWGFGAPVLILLGTLGFLGGLPAAPWAYAAAGLWALAVQCRLAHRRLDLASIVMALGTAAWAAGMWIYALGGDLAPAVLFWAAFPVLVIAGERLELAFQLRPRGAAWWAFLLSVGLVLVGAGLGLWDPLGAARVEALGFLGLAFWMLRFDVLGRGYAQGGLSRYMSVALWVGYAWLAVAGLLLLLWSFGAAQLWDGALHALFLGFMFAMIFAHAPVIIPAVSGLALRWHPGHYVHLAVLSLGLALRCAAGFQGSSLLKRHGALCAALALGLFLANQVISARLAARPAAPTLEPRHA